MKIISSRFNKLLLTLMLLMPFGASANNAYDFGDYIVYYNAFTADNLPAVMANAYAL